MGVPVLPLSGWMGDNLIEKTKNMDWWTGCDVIGGPDGKTKMHVDTLKECLNDFCSPPVRTDKAEMRMPVSGIYKIKGVGDVLAGRVEQGVITTNTEVIFMPTHTDANACAGKVFTIEMHHKTHPQANPGDNVGLNIKGLEKQNMPRVGDVMIYKKDKTLTQCGEFDAQIQTWDIPGEIKLGYSPIGFVRCGRSSSTRSKTARACPASPSSTATPPSCLARSCPSSRRRTCRRRRARRRSSCPGLRSCTPQLFALRGDDSVRGAESSPCQVTRLLRR